MIAIGKRGETNSGGVGRKGLVLGGLLVVALLGLWAPDAQAQAQIVQVTGISVTKGTFKPPLRFTGQFPFQVGTTTVEHRLSIADCEKLQKEEVLADFGWQWSPTAFTLDRNYAIKVQVAGTTDNCSDTSLEADSAAGCVTYKGQMDATNSATTNLRLSDLPGTLDCQGNKDGTAKIRWVLPSVSTTTTSGTYAGVSMDVIVDLARPASPTLGDVTAGDGTVHITWTQNNETGVKGWRVHWSSQPFDVADFADVEGHTGLLKGKSHTLTGLEVGQTYYVTVTSVDVAENESGAPEPISAKPVATQDLWEYYHAQGGTEEGGYAACQAARTGNHGTIALIGLGLGLLLLARRRTRKVSAGLLLVVVLAVPQVALAASPQTASTDVRFSQYEPKIDREFETTNQATPFADILGEGAWQFGLNVDLRALHGVLGELAFGVGASFWSRDGQSRNLSGSATSDATKLSIVPITADVVWRFDLLAERWDVPLVPYVRGGLAYALWWIEDNQGNVASVTKNGAKLRGMGGTGGLHGTAGLRLLLDTFEPQAARSFDIELGVNHSYLFAEYQKLSLTDFGNAKSIDLSDDLFVIGLAFDL